MATARDGDGLTLPAGFLAFASRSESWATWMAALPRLIRDVLAEWSLTPDGEIRSGQTAVAVPVLTRDGERAMAKFGWPHPEAEHEHLALRAWAGRGAVRLLQADPRRSVLLLERASADRDLTTVPVLEACEVVAGLYPLIHRRAIPQLDLLSTHAARWADELPRMASDGLVPRRYVTQAAGLAREFAADPATDGVLIHTDLHYFNVLAAEREPWLVIDPKPMSGEAAYEVAPMLWNRWDEAVASGNIRNAMLDRMYALVDAAGLDEERVRAWVIVRQLVNIKWALEDGPPATVEDREGITAAITIVKAVQR
ncbi:MAG: aminoglycoside phosphotransferase family protein [Propionibacteriaceae bacterium]